LYFVTSCRLSVLEILELVNSSIVEALRNNEFVEEIPTDEF
jgi:hypothetical protein